MGISPTPIISKQISGLLTNHLQMLKDIYPKDEDSFLEKNHNTIFTSFDE